MEVIERNAIGKDKNNNEDGGDDVNDNEEENECLEYLEVYLKHKQ